MLQWAILFSLVLGDKLIKLSALNEEDWYGVKKIEGVEQWLELKDVASSKLEKLSSKHLAFMNESLTFPFPFYGEDFTDIKITTQGFISLSDVISDTQYIGPLVANFKPYPTDNPTQNIRAHFLPDQAIIQWSDMILSDQITEGRFEFQLQLNKSGVILMLYKVIPLPLQKIEDKEHILVRAGISGGHPLGQTIPIPYSTISLTNITSNTTYILTPLATCIDQEDCVSCIGWSSMCNWCDSIKKCSSGQDRLKDIWTQNECYARSTRQCFQTASTHPSSQSSPYYSTHSGPPYHTTHNLTNHTKPHITTVPLPRDNHTTVVYNVSTPRERGHGQAKATDSTAPNDPASHSLSIIYIILIVASSLSFIFVTAALLILLNHKRRLRLNSETAGSQPEMNNLLNGSPPKC